MFLSIDLGSNTLRFALMDENLSVIKAFEKIVGAARNAEKSTEISALAQERLFEALKQAGEIFDFSAPHLGVATGVWRKAKNTKQILGTIKAQFGLSFNVISGENEAKLTLLGIENMLNKTDFNKQNFAFIDLGGASTEIGSGNTTRSFEFGIISFYERYANSTDPLSLQATILNSKAAQTTIHAREFLHSLNPKCIILTAGVPTTMVAFKLGLKFSDYAPDKINASELNFSDFKELKEKFLALSASDADKILGKDRRMLMIAGMALLGEILSVTNARLIVSDAGLREGVAVAHFKNLSKNLVK